MSTRLGKRGSFWELLRVEGRLALREPYILGGLGFPIGLLVIFWYIGKLNPGSVSNSGLTILELYIPTILVVGYVVLALSGMPGQVVRDREIGWLRRVSTTPVPPSRLLAAQLLLNVMVAGAATVIVIVAGAALFGAPLVVGLTFVGVVALTIAELFSLGLVVVALARTQTAASAITGVLFFPLLFFSGLWVQPVSAGPTLANIMYYSPTGAAVRALLYSVFNATPPYTTILTMLGYTALFVFVADRFFRWE